MQTLHIITACSRFPVLSDLAANVAKMAAHDPLSYLIRWHIAFQSGLEPDPHGCVKFNKMIDLVPAGDWIWILDDDNTVHPYFFLMLQTLFQYYAHTDKKAFVFSQNRSDVLGPVLHARPENMKVGGVDTAQVVFKKELLGSLLRFPEASKTADGEFYQELFAVYGPELFVFLPNDAVVNFNGCRK